MGKEELSNVINRLPEIEKKLKSISDSLDIKMIGKNVDFQGWKAELKQELQKIKREGLVDDILQLLNNGFKNGFRDEKDFAELKGHLMALNKDLDMYYDTQSNPEDVDRKMIKGTIIKTALDQYSLIKQIGQGGNGKVFAATNANGEEVAIKFVERNIARHKSKRLKNEIYFGLKHKHKNIVEVLDFGYVVLDNTEYTFYVMPHYEETLRGKIKKGINPEDAVTIFIGLMEGLKYAHEHDVIHRDIKPENIMFASDSVEPIICDFGIAHFAEEEMLTIIETNGNERMANFQYAAPEQRIRGKKVSPQTDVYAASLILNEMFTREIPQAEGYKTIESVAPDYQYLDDVFVKIFRQDALDRLYPEDKIIMEMKVRAEKYNREQEKLKLEKVIDNDIVPNDFRANVVNKQFVKGDIVFTLDCEIPQEWFQILLNGNLGTYSEVMGYERYKLKKCGADAIGMPIQGDESIDIIKVVVKYVLDWIEKANIAYSSHIKNVAKQVQRKKEATRKAEIAKLERENSISEILAQI